MENKTELCRLYPEELKQFILDLGESAFRAGQIQKWIKDGREIGEMSNLSKALREKLDACAYVNGVRIIESITSKLDGVLGTLFADFATNLTDVQLTGAAIDGDKIVINGSVF